MTGETIDLQEAAPRPPRFLTLRASLVAIVLFMPNMLRFPFTPLPGLNLLNILFIVALVMFVRAKRQFPDPSVRAPIRGYIWFFWIVSTIAMLNAWVLGDLPASFEDVVFLKNHIFYMLLYFLYFHAVRDRKTLDQVYWAIIVVTAVAGLEAMRQAASIGATSYSVGARVSGPFGQDWTASNTAGVFYAQFAPVIFSEFLYQKDLRLRILLGGAFAITVLGLFVTYSRKSYYALAAACALVGASASKLVLIGIAAAVLTFPLWAPESAVQRLQGSEEEKAEAGGAIDESTESRFILWAGAMQMWKDYPMGVGLERFKHHIGNYSVYSHLDAHNYYVLVLAEMGPLGLLAYLLMILMMYREGSRLAKVAKTPRDKALAGGFRGAMVAFMIANSFGSAFNFGIIMGNLWALAALVSRARLMIEQADAAPELPPVPQP
jgi:O-antigen ligase